jgi:predicted DNA binding protein
MRTADDERVVPRVSAGITPERLKETLTSGADEDMRLGIRTRACQTGETQIQDIGTDARPVLGEGDGPGTEVRSAAAVPLTHDNAVYGALTVYSARPERELQRERSVLELLGNAVGFGISARKTHKLLYADRVLEFELELTDSRLSLIRLWEQCDCPLRLSDCVASEGNAWSVFLTTEGQFPRGVSAIADADPDIQDIEVLDVDTNGGRVKLVLRESTLTTILGAGAKFTKGHIEDGRARLTFEMPLSGEPRSIINRVQNTYPEATVRSITERDRTVTSLGEFRESIDSTLTGRQREALRRAFARGYFDWPRQTTASEVAESMDIAETTFHYHRRRALQQLLGCYLETGTAAVDADGAED